MVQGWGLRTLLQMISSLFRTLMATWLQGLQIEGAWLGDTSTGIYEGIFEVAGTVQDLKI